MNKITISLILVIVLLLAGDIYFGYQCYLNNIQLQKLSLASRVNVNVLSFNKLFIEKVLKAQGEVSYEDRLLLENASANTKDDAIMKSWRDFLNSTTEAEAQQNVLNLLSMFPDKILY